MLTSLSFQPEISYVNRILSLLSLTIVGTLKLYQASLLPVYYYSKLNSIHLSLKILKNAYVYTIFLVDLLELGLSEFLILSIIVFPIIIGCVVQIRRFVRDRLYHRILSNKLTNQKDMVRALYLLLDGLETHDTIEH
jgi:hypothetical protein